MTTTPATTKQTTFLLKLAAERVTPSTWDAELPGLVAKGLNTKEASLLIARALTFPKLVVKPAAPLADELAVALAVVPKSKYALSFDELALFIPGLKAEGQEYMFVEVKEYMKRLYIRRLHGSVGDFTRSRLSREASIGVLKMIAQNPVEYSQKFGQLYSVCGCCAAPLTDDKSRELNLGPECRKRFGL